ncbi:MAG TPA: ring-cleaving dioxygenase [Ktedonobacterales bacterium]|nr:ring-cleaving dioxygenase [Ktedonobacterales bacterium]
MSNLTLTGLHHISAITGDTARNVTFYTQTLGLRLIKQTVNQDDVSAYHLFYGDNIGHPGTEVTFFDFPDATPNRPGVGMIHEIALHVPDRAALEWWRQHLATAALPPRDADTLAIVDRGGRLALPFADPDGLRVALVADPNETADVRNWQPWADSSIPPAVAIRGLASVTVAVARLEPTVTLLTEVLNFRQTGEYTDGEGLYGGAPVTVYSTAAGGLGAEVHLVARPGLPRGVPGVGGVHHVAFRTPDDPQQVAWRERLVAAGVGVTEVIDRFYFHSLYFREPGHALFEIATDGPGFTADEDAAHLGERLSLPPFLAPYRREIEAQLHPLMESAQAEA